MKKYLLIIALILATQTIEAQFLPEFSQQIKMPEFINPGYNAVKLKPTAIVLYGNNYVYLKGYNSIFAANFNLPINKWKTSFGITFIDELDIDIEKSNATFNTCVDIKILKSTQLTFGLGLGIERNENDNSKNQELYRKEPDFHNYFYSSSGLNLFTKNLHLGIGVHSTLIDQTRYFYYKNFSYFFNGSYLFVLSESPSIKPIFMCRFYNGESQYETGLFLNFEKIFETGMSFRFKQSIIYFADLRLFKLANIGYSYQYKFGNISNISYGLHEICLKLKIPVKFQF